MIISSDWKVPLRKNGMNRGISYAFIRGIKISSNDFNVSISLSHYNSKTNLLTVIFRYKDVVQPNCSIYLGFVIYKNNVNTNIITVTNVGSIPSEVQTLVGIRNITSSMTPAHHDIASSQGIAFALYGLALQSDTVEYGEMNLPEG